MQTNLSDYARTLPRAEQAERILRSCVHCGFCNATCPTYQVLGDELDGPRGRIYLIKSLLEGGDASEKTQQHLDRCLTCRNCETTCPSGVEYHTLLDIGRQEIEKRAKRPLSQRLLRQTLRLLLPRRKLFAHLLRIGQTVRPLLPLNLRSTLPDAIPDPGKRPKPRHERRMLMLEGCVQPSLSPNTNAATARVLDRLGISVIDTPTSAPAAGCCGAIEYHLNDQEAGLARARQNIDSWWPAIEAGAEAIVQTASGCGAFVKEYGQMLSDDPDYAEKAKVVSNIARDISEVLQSEPLDALQLHSLPRAAFHCPCTLQHAQRLGGRVENLLTRLGMTLTPVPDAHLCCGSAGTYSITEPVLAKTLRDNKLRALETGKPDIILTANIGCQTHLAGGTQTPVRHWIELIDEHVQYQGEHIEH